MLGAVKAKRTEMSMGDAGRHAQLVRAAAGQWGRDGAYMPPVPEANTSPRAGGTRGKVCMRREKVGYDPGVVRSA